MKRGIAAAVGLLAIAVLPPGNVMRIDEVLSGDLVRIGDTFKARLTGVKAPGRNEPLGSEVYDFTKRELEGQTVKLFTWTTDNTAAGVVYDEDGCARVQIFYGKRADVSFNEVLLKKGYARVDPKFLPDELNHYYDLEKEARDKGLGIWNDSSPLPDFGDVETELRFPDSSNSRDCAATAEALRRLRARAGTSGPESCTIVMAARDGLVLAGNNEDRDHPQTIVTFVPASGEYYGRIVFGYDDAPVQGGMNDQGLFIDGNALRPTGWQPDPGKPRLVMPVMTTILATCATCADVEALFEKWNVPALEQARFPVADRTGASMVVEYGQGRVQFVRSDTWFQIATNFVMSNIKDGEFPCWRYRAADKVMSAAKRLSVELIREALEKTRQSGRSRTVYSNICDLKRGLIHVYNLGDFDDVVVLDLAEELRKDQRQIALASLFGSRARQ